MAEKNRSGRAYMKTRQAANYMSLSKSTLDKNRMGIADIPYIRLAGSIRYDPDSLDEYMKAREAR